MRVRKLLLAAAVFFAATELLLQLAAFVVSWSLPSPVQVQGPSVVCLGDSYTAGIGATSPANSYPAQLEQQLAQRGRAELRVVNGGCPGQDSAFLVRQVPNLLQPQTRVLCVLMAFNDTWSRPARIEWSELQALPGQAQQNDYGRFEWRWRTGRLLALCGRFFANSWHRSSADAASPVAAVTPSIGDADAGFALLQGAQLIVEPAELPTFAAPPPAALQQRLGAVEQQFFRGDGRQALSMAQALVAEHADCAAAQKTVAVAAHLAGQHERAQAALQVLAEAAAQDVVASENLVIALQATGRTEQAVVAARAHLQREPRSVAAALVLQDALYQLGRTEEFAQVAPGALRLCGRLFVGQSAMIARHLAVVVGARDPEHAAVLLVAAALLDGNVALTRAKVSALRGAVTLAQLGAALDLARPAAEATRSALRQVLTAAHADDGSEVLWAATLEHHLLLIGRLCAERGTQMILLGYPFAHAELERVQRSVAAQLGVPFVAVRERFDRELQTRSHDELFVRNGHCSDAGYAILAELAAAAIEALPK